MKMLKMCLNPKVLAVLVAVGVAPARSARGFRDRGTGAGRHTAVDDPDLERFVRAYKQGPQTPEPGAACTGGLGDPV
jgi:hypothetical protein